MISFFHVVTPWFAKFGTRVGPPYLGLLPLVVQRIIYNENYAMRAAPNAGHWCIFAHALLLLGYHMTRKC